MQTAIAFPRHAQRIAFVVAACLGYPAAVGADPLKAKPADAFTESVGVNVHAHTNYEKHHTEVKAKLKALGVRHVRDGSHANSCRYAAEFFADLGIKTTFITGRRVGGKVEYKSPLDPARIDDELADIKTLALAAAAAIEGPNEYDLYHDERETDWPGKLRTYQRDLFDKVKADAQLKGLPVVGPSLTSEEAYKAVGDLDNGIDHPCVHLYQSTRHPGTGGWGANGYGSIGWAFERLVAVQSPARKPVWSTECGYKPGDKNDPISEKADAAYTVRMYAEFFRRGIARSFKYELLGDEWGLVRDDLTERPAFDALKSLLTLTADPGEEFEPATLDFAVAGAEDARHTLLQQRDGTFLLLLWREVPVWDVAAKKDAKVAEKEVRISFKDAVRAVDVHVPNVGPKPAESHDKPTKVSVRLGGELVVLVLKTAEPAAAPDPAAR